MNKFPRQCAIVLVLLLVPVSGWAQQKAGELLRDARQIEAEVHANFASWPAGQVLQKKGFSPKGVSCGQVCEVLSLGACYQQGRPAVGTYGKAGPCDRPTKKSCWCDSGRRDYGFFHQEAVTSGTKVYRLHGDRIHIGNAETGTSTSAEVGKIGRSSLYVAGNWLGVVPNSGTKTYIRMDLRTGKLKKTFPIAKDSWAKCGFIHGVGPRLWICERRADGGTYEHALIDPATSRQYTLPPSEVALLSRSIQGHWDGTTLLYAKPLGAAEWDVRRWKRGAKKWEIHRAPEHPVRPLRKPDADATRDVLNAGVFRGSIWSMDQFSMATAGAYHSPRTSAEWVDSWLFVPTLTALWGFDSKTKIWQRWALPNARDHAKSYRSLFAVGDTVVIDELMLDRASGELRPLARNFHAVWAGEYALIFHSDCPRGGACKPLQGEAFKDVAVWKPVASKLSSDGAIRASEPALDEPR